MEQPNHRDGDEGADRRFVIIVEDDPIQATMYQLGLQAAGFRVAVFPHASAMFEALEAEVPDVAVLDWRFAGSLTGVDVIDNMRLDPRLVRLPIVMLSNHDGQVDGAAERALKAGAAHWLTKSKTTPEQLAATLKQTIDRKTIQPPGHEAEPWDSRSGGTAFVFKPV